jgi:ribonucleoside-triphosphate reductase
MSIIIKRNKKAEVFDKEKLRNSLIKVFNSCNSELTEDIFDKISDRIRVTEGMNTSQLRKQVENILMMLGYFEQARCLIVYHHINRYSKSMGDKVQFMRDYLNSSNAATGSKYDANANVTVKNVATMNNELFKGDTIKLNRYRLSNRINELYGKELADEYIRQLECHEIYKHDESSIFPYCVAISCYSFLLDGLSSIGGLSTPPKSLESFCGGFINLIFAISANFAGAVASPEFLMYFDYFARKEWGDDYYLNPDLEVKRKLINGEWKGVSIDKQINQHFQNVVYSINQPSGARGFQSVFWNIGYFDKYYFEGIFKDFAFPDGTKPKWESLCWLQKKFMKWFNQERLKSVITFPVESFSLLVDKETNEYLDKDAADFVAEMYAEGHSFFTYVSDNPDALSSCCRLRNEIDDNTFAYTLGGAGVATGSKSVITLNLNRLIQLAVKEGTNYIEFIREQIHKVHKYQLAFDSLLEDFHKAGALTVYDAGYISMDKQYLTLGLNGLVEAAEFLGIPIGDNELYRNFVNSILEVFYEENKKARTKDIRFNTEMVPAENLGIKFYKWDKEDGYIVPKTRNCYNSYFYVVEDNQVTILEKFKLHGRDFVKHLDGGSALHCNLDEHLSKAQYAQLLKVAAKEGTNYFTFNIPNTVCNECGHIDKRHLKECPCCSSHNLDYLTRIIGYLKRVSNFSEARQIEASRRYYAKNTEQEQEEINKELEC